VTADNQAVMGRRLVSAVAATLLAVGGLLMAAGPAQAEPAVSSQAQLTPNPGEWWFPDWQVEQKVWPLARGAGVTVAVLDTGVQASLPDLRGVVRPGGDMTRGGSRGETDSDARGDGHGTAVAALIAGQGSGTGTVGIAPRARILPVTVGREGPPSASVVAEAIRFAVGHGAQVINMSFGLQVASPATCDPVLQAAIAYALERNVILIATAIPAGRPVPDDGYGYGIVDLARAVNASAYPVRASAPDPVYARFTAWLATPGGRAAAATTPAVAVATAKGGPGMTLEGIVITGVAAACVFAAVLVFVLSMSSRRRSGTRNPYGPRMLRDPPLVTTAAPTHARGPGRWEERAWSFGPHEDEDDDEAGYGRPPGYGPPPLWTEEPYDPPGWR
jgi:subtilisin family serine protease